MFYSLKKKKSCPLRGGGIFICIINSSGLEIPKQSFLALVSWATGGPSSVQEKERDHSLWGGTWVGLSITHSLRYGRVPHANVLCRVCHFRTKVETQNPHVLRSCWPGRSAQHGMQSYYKWASHEGPLKMERQWRWWWWWWWPFVLKQFLISSTSSLLSPDPEKLESWEAKDSFLPGRAMKGKRWDVLPTLLLCLRHLETQIKVRAAFQCLKPLRSEFSVAREE